jgi:hypothetical protein
MDWNKLVIDLKESNELAKAAADSVDDGGTCNLDSVFLRIPRRREEKVLQAIKDAGLYCRAKRKWIGTGYMITPISGGQANKRSKAVEVMKKELNDRGWDVIGFYMAN